MLIVALIIVSVLIVGAAAGAWVRGRLLLPSDHKRLDVLASELHTKARMDALTRWTAQAMRDSVRKHLQRDSVR
jgi:uncharacterized membrane protein